MDLVRGKGTGCIILLHGVPGVSKTSSAECVDAHTGKPLYPITYNKLTLERDIGYKPEDVERNMENHFKLVHRSGCVLLLDEADVFLAKRGERDVQRNELVSVFLRILEYYGGILFLTTNRVGSIDDAFRSRLNLTLYYPELTKSQAFKIFKRNFRRIAEINVDRGEISLPPFEYKDSEKKIITWVKVSWRTLRWNGRRIRSAFQTVLALAEFHVKAVDDSESMTPVVTRKHFKTMANASIQFNSYLKQTHGLDEDELAERAFVRVQEFSPSGGQGRSLVDEEESDDSSSEEESDEISESGDNSETEDEKKRKKTKQTGKKEKADKSAGSKGKKTKEKKKSEKHKKDKKSRMEEESYDSD